MSTFDLEQFATAARRSGVPSGRRGRRRWLLGSLVAVLLCLPGCGASGPGAVAPPTGAWRSAPGVEHPLTGRVWASGARDYVTPEALVVALRAAPYVLLGEKHDNPDHHGLQAWVLDGLLADGSHSAVAFEMLNDDVTGALANLESPSAEEVARAVGWDASGWPSFELYAPVFDAALSAGARLVAAHPDRQTLRGVMTDGIAGWPASRRVRLGLDQPLPAAAQAALAEEIRVTHCGHAPPGLVVAMSRAQSVKDAWMAWRLAEAAADGKGGVLIAGAGHVRRDRAVPFYLKVHDPRPVATVAFVEVDEARRAAADYADLAAHFDYLWFTPRVDDMDPCARFQAQLERMRDEHGAGDDD